MQTETLPQHDAIYTIPPHVDITSKKEIRCDNLTPLDQSEKTNKKSINKLTKIKNSEKIPSQKNNKKTTKALLLFILLLGKIENQLRSTMLTNCIGSAFNTFYDRYRFFSLPTIDSGIVQHHDFNHAEHAHSLAYDAQRSASTWFSFPPAMATASHLSGIELHPFFNLSDIFIDSHEKSLFYQYNEASNKNTMLSPLALKKNKILFEMGRKAIANYYRQFHDSHPSLKTRARTLLNAELKRKFNIDINPDKIYFMHFNAGIACSDTITGWFHRTAPIEWGPLTRYLFTNFPADAQETIDSTNMWCGIYNVLPNMTTEFGKENEVRILPVDFINIIWNIDFYQKAKSAYQESYADKGTYVKKNFMDFILNLAIRKPDRDTTNDILAGIGLIENNDVMVTQFDINGYQASSLFVFTNKRTLRVTLYVPHHDAKFLSFSHLFDMRVWIINNCVDKAHRDVIASHFSLYNRQDGIIYDGIDKWLNTLSHEVIAEEYMDKICSRFIPLAPQNFFDVMTTLEHERFLKDLDILIKSDAEVTRDIWERDIDISNMIPNPVSPFISLGLHLEHALDGDTQQERLREWNNVAYDLVSIILMVLMEKTLNAATDGYDFINTIKHDISDGIANRAFDDLLPLEEIHLSEIELQHIILTANADHPLFINNELLEKFEFLPMLDENLFIDLTPNDEGIFLYQTPNDPSEKMAIRINDKFYALTETEKNRVYLLDNKEEIILYDGVYYNRKKLSEGSITYLSCQIKRSPGASCIHYSQGLHDVLSQYLPEAMTEVDVGAKHPHEKYPSFYINHNGKMFIPYNDVFFRVKESSSGFKILAKKHTSFFHKLLSRKVLTKFHFSRTNGMYYLNTPIENTMESLGCSKAAAELYHFNVKNSISRDHITREELYAIKSYGNMGYDPINSYMQEGMPKTNTVPLNSEEHLAEAVKNIRSLLNKLPSYKGTVYRGGALTREEFAALQPGDIITSKKFISTSTDINIAKSYAQSRGADGVFYTIKTVQRGHPIGMYTMRIHEAEVLIEDNTLFRCSAVNERNVVLEEIADRDNSATDGIKVVSMR